MKITTRYTVCQGFFRIFFPNKNDTPTISFIWGTATHKLRKSQSAIDTANVVLLSNPTWAFSHDNSIDSTDLHLVLAQCYYLSAIFDSSLIQVREYYDPNFWVDVNTPAGMFALGEKVHEWGP